MKHTLTIAICLLMLAGVACKKRNTVPANELHFTETVCANPWMQRVNILEVPRNDAKIINDWLVANNITPLKITISVSNGGPTCYACHCPSGRIVKVLFNTADLEKAKALGFYKP
ncbi:hypothetical protein [Chitinophaga niabensis]|uniref:Uncharacterized protein n=1 Tax=Chitinophaga niabensis TaxID=536979 RepID=A0A1N6H6N4_9BACT|nr:hypothetical protein [Chitinophaga niabensis]SIO15444.1 hypothetical protein SAMN04488055_3209 [Chitinophaga niabensis]